MYVAYIPAKGVKFGDESPLGNCRDGGCFVRLRHVRARLIGDKSEVTKQRERTTLRWPLTRCESSEKAFTLARSV
eukprot:1525566-Pleurochrysis_carterae.AAC.1